jgi:hypothetical protein
LASSRTYLVPPRPLGVFALVGAVSAAAIGPFLVLVLLAGGGTEVAIALRGQRPGSLNGAMPYAFLLASGVTGDMGALIWVAFKVGALSYGGGFVIVPLMQADAVPGRRGAEPTAWLEKQGKEWRDQVRYATLDLSSPYCKVFTTMVPDAVAPEGSKRSTASTRPNWPKEQNSLTDWKDRKGAANRFATNFTRRA